MGTLPTVRLRHRLRTGPNDYLLVNAQDYAADIAGYQAKGWYLDRPESNLDTSTNKEKRIALAEAEEDRRRRADPAEVEKRGDAARALAERSSQRNIMTDPPQKAAPDAKPRAKAPKRH